MTVGRDARTLRWKGGFAMRILLAVDGSGSSDRARDLVAALPWSEGGRVRIVSVAPTGADLMGTPWPIATVSDDPDLESEALRIHRDALDAAEREIRSARSDLIIESRLLRGRAASVIVEEARQMSADLVVVGHRGHGRWESILLGSVSAEVVDHAPCPVLVARDERLGPIVLADDGSPYARAAGRWSSVAALPGADHHRRDGQRDIPYAATAPMLYQGRWTAHASHRVEQRRWRPATAPRGCARWS
jgi:nucleotide-binding universal stress UspA family protein